MFRIVQESLNNVRRHAEASHVVVKLACHDAQWTLTVRDDGRGFSPASRSAGYGLLGMEERARLLAGSLRVLSAPGQGTTVELNVVPGAPPVPPP
ncbi:ATP-binding protein [Roseateles sp. UC29_93]|uniref:ATP-binding protein n=1 Tax=Roseateles sp. UC29_93 TaxID=3350177 RepID=UPI0036715FF0